MSADGGQAVTVNPGVEPFAWVTIDVDVDGVRVEAVRGEWWLLTRTLDAEGTVRADGFAVEPMAKEVWRLSGHDHSMAVATRVASCRRCRSFTCPPPAVYPATRPVPPRP